MVPNGYTTKCSKPYWSNPPFDTTGLERVKAELQNIVCDCNLLVHHALLLQRDWSISFVVGYCPHFWLSLVTFLVVFCYYTKYSSNQVYICMLDYDKGEKQIVCTEQRE